MTTSMDGQLKADLLALIRAECPGRHHGLPHRELALRIGARERRERRLVNELVAAGHLIGASTTCGVFWVVDEADYREGRKAMADIAYPVMERMRAFEAAWAAAFPPKQAALWEQAPDPGWAAAQRVPSALL